MATTRKRRRKPQTINGLGSPDDLEQFEYDYGANTGSAGSFGWSRSIDPDIVKTEVPNDTPLDPRVVAVSRDFPRAGITTWYAPTTQAIASGKTQAAVDTIAATGAQLTAAGESILGVAGAVVQNLPLILLGLAALFLMWEKSK